MFLHEIGFFFVGMVASLLLAGHGSWPLAIEAASLTTLWALWVWLFRNDERMLRVRMVLTIGWLIWFSLAIERIVPGAGLPVYDAALLDLDESILGETPAAAMGVFSSSKRTEVLSACYLFYLAYLGLSLLDALTGPLDSLVRVSRVVFLAYIPGLMGHLLVPAHGPLDRNPPLFAHPLQGGWVTDFTARVIDATSIQYDSVPSMPVLLTLTLLTYDSCYNRRRFVVAFLPSVGVCIAAMYLRYHYGVDLVVSLGCWIGLLAIWRVQGLVQ